MLERNKGSFSSNEFFEKESSKINERLQAHALMLAGIARLELRHTRRIGGIALKSIFTFAVMIALDVAQWFCGIRMKAQPVTDLFSMRYAWMIMSLMINIVMLGLLLKISWNALRPDEISIVETMSNFQSLALVSIERSVSVAIGATEFMGWPIGPKLVCVTIWLGIALVLLVRGRFTDKNVRRCVGRSVRREYHWQERLCRMQRMS